MLALPWSMISKAVVPETIEVAVELNGARTFTTPLSERLVPLSVPRRTSFVSELTVKVSGRPSSFARRKLALFTVIDTEEPGVYAVIVPRSTNITVGFGFGAGWSPRAANAAVGKASVITRAAKAD